MLHYTIETVPGEHKKVIKTPLRGKALLGVPQLNKDSAFTNEERHELALFGKLPKRVETLEEQVVRAYFQLQNHTTRLSKYIFLNDLLDKNQVLYYKLICEHLNELLPIIYTPTVSTAVKTFNKKFRKSRGLYICYDDMEYMEEIFKNRSNEEVTLIVVTDGEGVLGIGDHGISAMDIPIAKLAVYTALGGINPLHTLPIMLDVGTDNQELLNDPMYLGWHNNRIRGDNYDRFIKRFVGLVKQYFPKAFLHWEDLGRANATRVLNQYRHELCTFNDDIQGTGVVALAAILAGIKANNSKLKDQRIVIFGAGSAGLGIANSLLHAAQMEGLNKEAALDLFWIIDRDGLVTTSNQHLTNEQKGFARDASEVKNWEKTDLLAVVTHIKPTILIGTSGCANAFSEEIIKTMAKCVERPIIMPLSNPNVLCEANPENIDNWTNHQARIATGSPFKNYSQCNNALIFPALGLAVLITRCKQLPDSILYEAAKALSLQSPISANDDKHLLPDIATSKAFTKQIAFAIGKAIVNAKLGDNLSDEEIRSSIDEAFWEPEYYRILPS